MVNGNFNFKDIEDRWQKQWLETGVNKAPIPTSDKPPYYILVMFPYPSGHLHMGHVRNYTIGDILARFYRRRGRSVLHPIGWDAFGLPAENAAIERGIDPGKWTWDNIAHMRGQLKKLGISYDWDREFATCDPNYFKWNQWIFIQMVKKGLAYRKKSVVNWDPVDQTVLANEQVIDGKGWRTGAPVIQKELEQWFFKITSYSKQLLADHSELKPGKDQKGWPEQVLAMQKNWIGESWGAYVDFPISNQNEKIRVFTTRPDTLYGATFMVLAPEHPLVEKISTNEYQEPVSDYQIKARSLSSADRVEESREKTGQFTGAYAVNPLTGKEIPIWIADYVLTDYGTGAIMAVPAHDERDFSFARKFQIPVVTVIQRKEEPLPEPLTEAFVSEGVMTNSGPFDGLPSLEAKRKVADFLKEKGIGEPTITYRLRDWLLSRQRYWGTPIPMVYCDNCGVLPVKEKDLPVRLPENIKLTGKGESPLKNVKDWINTKCPSCAKSARRETDTMDTFVDSSWYYARYTDSKNPDLPFASKKANQWLPVTQYVGGIEHACMHLIYSRFFHKVFNDLNLVSSKEPFSSLLTQGMVTLGGSAMSKSKGNTVDPNEVISKFGADTCRTFIMFAAPPTQQLEWSDKQVEGIWRFLNRVWRLGRALMDGDEGRAPKRQKEQEEGKMGEEELVRLTHLCISRVTHDIETDFGFNTAIAAIMELVNAIYLYPRLSDPTSRKAIETVLMLLHPFAPHMTEELWEKMGKKQALSEVPWPEFDPTKLIEKNLQIVVQINGKLRDKITVSAGAAEEEVKSKALQTLSEKGHKIEAKRIIYVPNKLVNFVVLKN